jgi:hypothetical protein
VLHGAPVELVGGLLSVLGDDREEVAKECPVLGREGPRVLVVLDLGDDRLLVRPDACVADGIGDVENRAVAVLRIAV